MASHRRDGGYTDDIPQDDNKHVVAPGTPLKQESEIKKKVPANQSPTQAYREEESMLPFALSKEGEGNHHRATDRADSAHETKVSTLEKQ
ncbi:MAG: hypothetical protein H7Y12_08375, partial [Sphingobacteriaceae bacterium]|nr:hypothetical protein [Cytophagaceae bacterium]